MLYTHISWPLSYALCKQDYKRKMNVLTNYKYHTNLICFAFIQQTSSELQALSDQFAHLHSSD